MSSKHLLTTVNTTLVVALVITALWRCYFTVPKAKLHFSRDQFVFLWRKKIKPPTLIFSTAVQYITQHVFSSLKGQQLLAQWRWGDLVGHTITRYYFSIVRRTNSSWSIRRKLNSATKDVTKSCWLSFFDHYRLKVSCQSKCRTGLVLAWIPVFFY